jgi:hypothetical protein
MELVDGRRSSGTASGVRDHHLLTLSALDSIPFKPSPIESILFDKFGTEINTMLQQAT